MKFFLHLGAFLFIVRVQFHSILSQSVAPNLGCNEEQTAETLYNALFKDVTNGTGINDEGIKKVLINYSCTQRLDIAKAYKTKYNQELMDAMREKTGGSYRRLMTETLLCGEDLFAENLKIALKDGSDDWEADGYIQRKNLIEIMVTCSESKERHDNLLAAYQRMFQTSVQEAFEKNLDGDFKNVMLEMAARARRPTEPIDEAKAQEVAQQLNDGRKGWNDDRQILDVTLMETPFEQLELVFNKFKEISGNDLENVIDDKLGGSLKNTYQDLIHYCKTYKEKFVGYYTKRFQECVDGTGTDEQSLIRLVLYQSEREIWDIEDKFKADYGIGLGKRIEEDTEGAFKELLLGFFYGNMRRVE